MWAAAASFYSALQTNEGRTDVRTGNKNTIGLDESNGSGSSSVSGMEENGDIRNLNISDQNANTPHNTPHTDSNSNSTDSKDKVVPVPLVMVPPGRIIHIYRDNGTYVLTFTVISYHIVSYHSIDDNDLLLIKTMMVMIVSVNTSFTVFCCSDDHDHTVAVMGK